MPIDANEVVDLTRDSDASNGTVESDDSAPRQAIVLSLEGEKLVDNETEPFGDTENAAGLLGGLMGLNRRQMEEERLARLKRKREDDISPPPVTRRIRSPPATDANARQISYPPFSHPATNASQALRVRHSPVGVRNTLTTDLGPASLFCGPQGSIAPPSCTSIKFPRPTVRQTWCFGFPRSDRPTDIKLEELIDRPNLHTCVLSSFIWDFDWLLPKFDTKRTKFLLVMHAKGPEQRTHIEQDWSGIPNVRLCFPNMAGQINSMHSKLMLLFFEKHLRVVIPSANLISFDWGENGGVMENTVFVVDLPQKCAPNAKDYPSFYHKLDAFIQAQDFPPDVVKRLANFDWSATASIDFVASIGGAHTGEEWKSIGLCGLGRSVASLGLHSKNNVQIDFVTSSLGSLNEAFMRSMYSAAQGDDGLTEYTLRTAKKFPAFVTGSKDRSVTRDVGNDWKTSFRVYFPSDETVKQSRGGPRNAGTICFNEGWWNKIDFPRENVRDCISRRAGLLMHNKVGGGNQPDLISANFPRSCLYASQRLIQMHRELNMPDGLTLVARICPSRLGM